MIFFCSPIGLGHVTRDSAIVQHLQDITTKFVTGNGGAKFLEQSKLDVENSYVPPQFSVENGLLQNPLRWLWKYYKYYKDCKNISSKIIKKEMPDVVVSDEDFASAAIAQEQNLPIVILENQAYRLLERVSHAQHPFHE